MRISDWVLILTSLFLGFCALFVPYLSECLKRKLYKPSLKILFELEPPFCHKTNWNKNPSWPVYYFRLQVINEGKSLARNCELILEKLWLYDSSNNKYEIIKNFSPVNIVWVGSTNQFVDINPERKIFCDIGHISSKDFQEEREKNKFVDINDYNRNDLRFVLEQYNIYFSQPNCLIPGKYILQLGLYSENACYQKVCFEILWSGKWKENEKDMFQEIMITRVKCLE